MAKALLSRVTELGGRLDVAGKRQRLSELEAFLEQPDVWGNPAKAQEIGRQTKRLKDEINRHSGINGRVHDLLALIEIAEEEGAESEAPEIDRELNQISESVDSYELECTLSGEHDAENCYLTIHPGAGGTESCDWADMLLRMYLRYFELRGYSIEVIDHQPGDEAGVKNVTLWVKGDYAFGRLRAEHGIHRLVRISPFDSQSRRHTSFTSISVVPEIDDDIEIEIDEKDLRVDTYRSSGAGGQHVNKTDSAVRLTHLPTGIVVCCQNERSQHKNRATAMKVLRSKLYELQIKEQEERLAAATDEKKEIAWGHQIRSYVFHPYNLVKDHRSGYETSNVSGVMDGNLDPFIESYLRWRLGKVVQQEP
ncbi:MAG: peptide chain release factor 2 [Candidatus Omnitrophica bacterium]|nr:peptide chain release factor 2 [Candidatus Omnitrophota bacterium]